VPDSGKRFESFQGGGDLSFVAGSEDCGERLDAARLCAKQAERTDALLNLFHGEAAHLLGAGSFGKELGSHPVDACVAALSR